MNADPDVDDNGDPRPFAAPEVEEPPQLFGLIAEWIVKATTESFREQRSMLEEFKKQYPEMAAEMSRGKPIVVTMCGKAVELPDPLR